jgi:superoxide dismutase, Fe-Mn family
MRLFVCEPPDLRAAPDLIFARCAFILLNIRGSNERAFNHATKGHHYMITRRHALQSIALGVASLSTAPWAPAQAQKTEPFRLPPLPYPSDALEPHIDGRTMEIHHGRHHASYISSLNGAVNNTPAIQGVSVEQLLQQLDKVPESARTAVRNHGGGHHNHLLFWQMLSPKGGGQPTGELAGAIQRQFGGFDSFREQFTRAALGQFGSGWAWLSLTPNRQLQIEATANQDSTLSRGHVPLLGVDVWEHAYYLLYQNRRADYVAAFFNVVNWDYVAQRYHNGTP